MRYETADLIVVGGGLPGTLAACEAVRRGQSVLLVDQGRPGVSRHEVTGACLRLVQADPARVGLARAAAEGWQKFEQEVGERLLKAGESLDLAPAPRADELERHLDLAGIASQRLQSSRWPLLRFDGDIQALQTMAWTLAVSAAWDCSWRLAQRAGVRCFADTPVRFLDLEYDRITAVAQDTAFRGKAMLCTVSSLLVDLPVKRVTQQWESTCEPLDCPHLYFHFSGTPAQLVTGGGYRVNRRRREAQEQVDPQESERLREFLERWLPQAALPETVALFESEESSEGNLLLGRHSLREDLVVLAALADVGPQLAPGLAPLAIDLTSGVSAGPESFALVKPVERDESTTPGGR